MDLVSLHSTINVFNSLPLTYEATYSRNRNLSSSPKPIHKKYIPLQASYGLHNFHSPVSYHAAIQKNFPPRQTGYLQVPFCTQNTTPADEENHRALETVLKLYIAIKNKNIQELSDVIGDECRCICNFITFSQPFHGKKQVLDFFSYLIRSLGNNIEFIAQPTMQDGMNVGVSWKLQFNKTLVNLGKGFSFYILHNYEGEVLIGKVEMFTEPLFHIEPFQLKVMRFVTVVMDKMVSNKAFKNKAKSALYILLSLVFMAALLLFIKNFVSMQS